jgi:hypothetical protein
MTTTQRAKPLLLDSKGELLRARTFSATSIHTPKPEHPARTLCGGRIVLPSEYECDGSNSRHCEHERPQLHQADLTICAGANPQLCKRCEKSVARRQREAQATQLAPGTDAPKAAAPTAAEEAKPARARIIEAAGANGWTADKGYSSEGAWAGRRGPRHVSLEFSVSGGITWACTDEGVLRGRGKLARVLEYVSAWPDQGMPMRDIGARPKAPSGPAAVWDRAI